MKRNLAVPGAALLSALMLAGCAGAPSGSSGNADQEYAQDAELSLLLTSDAGNYHPLLTSGSSVGQVSRLTSDSLIWVDPSTGELRPWIATEWTEEPNSISLTIRDGVTCSNGDPFTAETVARNFEFVLDPANASPWYDAFVPADATVSVDGNVVSLETPGPRGFLAFGLAGLPLVCDVALDDPESFQGKSASTGLFELTNYVPGDSLTLERRDDYAWAPDETTGTTAGLPKTVTMKIVSDPSTSANLVQAGDANFAVIKGADQERLLAAGLEYREDRPSPEALFFNHVEGVPTADPAVRTALTQTLDLDELTQVMLAGRGERATSSMTTSPRACTYDSVTGNLPDFDASAASRTLEKAGWKPGADGVLEKDGQRLHIELLYINTNDSVSAAAEIVAAEWEKLGAEVQLTGGDYTWMVGAAWSPDDLTSWTATLGLTLSSDSPSTFVPVFSGDAPPEGVNFSSIANDTYLEKVKEATAIPGEAACDVWAEAEAAQFKAVDFAPIASAPTYLFMNGATTTTEGTAPFGFALRALK